MPIGLVTALVAWLVAEAKLPHCAYELPPSSTASINRASKSREPQPMVGSLNTPTPNTEGNHQGKATYVNEPGFYSTRMLEPEVSTICRNLGAEGDPSMSVLNALTLLP